MKAQEVTLKNRNMEKHFFVYLYLLVIAFIIPSNHINAQTTFLSNDENGTDLSTVDLVFFSVVKSGLNYKLKWSTATEYNNDFFTIEKSINGVNYEIIGFKEAIGNSTEQSNYLLIDKDVTSVINYYRIKNADNNGQVNVLDELVIDLSSNRIKKEVISTINLFGEEVTDNFRGEVIKIYMDGSSVKVIQ